MALKKHFLDKTKCKFCNDLLTRENAVWHKSGQYLSSECRECRRKRVDKYNKTKGFGGYLIRTYNLTMEERNKILELQGNVCAICKGINEDGRPLFVDHDHKLNITRGLLCMQCNSGIGNFKEDEDIFWNALEYLKKYKWSKVA